MIGAFRFQTNHNCGLSPLFILNPATGVVALLFSF